MDGFWNKYFLIFTITKDIVLHPFEFGSTIRDTMEETKRAALYVGEGMVLFYAVFQLLIAGQETDLPLSNLPFAGEIIAAGMIASAMLTGFITHPVASFFSSRSNSVHGSLASFLYWTGCCMFVIPPVFTVVIMGSQWLFGLLELAEDWKLLIVMAVMVPIVFVYYIGTISSWIGTVYDIEPFMGGIAIACSYALFMGAATALTAVISFATGYTF